MQLSVLDTAFGVGTGTGNDDRDAIQACLDAAASELNATVLFPSARYHLGSSVSAPTTSSSIALIGEAPTIKGSHIVVGFNGPAFNVAGTLFSVERLSMVGNRAQFPSARAFKFAKTTNTDDMDVRVRNVCLQEFGVAIEHKGRGFYLQDSIIALCDRAATFSWPTSGVTGTGLHVPPYGFRKTHLTDNHLHAIGVAFENLSTTPMRGVLASGNLMDIGRGFWKGAANASVFGSNVIENLNATGFEFTTSADDVQVVGNRIAGMPEPAAPDSSIYQALSGVSLQTTGTVRGFMAQGNNIRYVRQDGIRSNKALLDSDISGNTISDYAMDGPEFSAIAVLNTSGLANAFSSSTMRDNGGTAPVSPGVFAKINGATPGSIVDNRR